VEVKILGISGSPRHGNTEIMVKEALKSAEELPEVRTHFISLAEKTVKECKADYLCFEKQDTSTPCLGITDDDANDILLQMRDSDGLIIGSPVYFGTVTSVLKALMDRSLALEGLGLALRNKVGGVIACSMTRSGGVELVIRTLHNFFLLHDMVVVGIGPERRTGKQSRPGVYPGVSSYFGAVGMQGWPEVTSDRVPERLTAVRQDVQGIITAKYLGKRVAEVAKVLKLGFREIREEEIFYPAGVLPKEIPRERKLYEKKR